MQWRDKAFYRSFLFNFYGGSNNTFKNWIQQLDSIVSFAVQLIDFVQLSNQYTPIDDPPPIKLSNHNDIALKRNETSFLTS